jgi:hypothetical protein
LGETEAALPRSWLGQTLGGIGFLILWASRAYGLGYETGALFKAWLGAPGAGSLHGGPGPPWPADLQGTQGPGFPGTWAASPLPPPSG